MSGVSPDYPKTHTEEEAQRRRRRTPAFTPGARRDAQAAHGRSLAAARKRAALGGARGRVSRTHGGSSLCVLPPTATAAPRLLLGSLRMARAGTADVDDLLRELEAIDSGPSAAPAAAAALAAAAPKVAAQARGCARCAAAASAARPPRHCGASPAPARAAARAAR